MVLSVFTDGGSRGNPGISGFGVVIKSGEGIVHQEAVFIGIKTNNEAEYSALLSALSWISQNKNHVEKINFYLDSELVVRQVQGIYKIKAENLKPLYLQIKGLLEKLGIPYEFKSVPRAQNSLADALANQAMDRQS